MRKRRLMILIMFVTSIFLSGEAFSAWTQAKGHSYNQLTLSYYKTTKKFTTIKRDEDKRVLTTNASVYRDEQEEFTSTKVTYYGEYGITDDLTIIASIPYDWEKSNDTMKYAGEDGPTGVGDIDLGLRQKISNNLFGSGALMSLEGKVKIPEAYDYGHPLRDLSLGKGQYDATLAILFGKGFSKGYGVVNIGYKYCFENSQYDPITFKPSDQIRVTINGGYPLFGSLMELRGVIDWTKSVGNAKVSDELIKESYAYGGSAKDGDAVLIKETLVLEPDVLNGTVSLAFNVAPKMQAVVSYVTDLAGGGIFSSKNTGLGETVSIAFVYNH